MIQLLLAFGPLPISLFVVTGMWLLIKWAGRARKHSKELKAKIKKLEMWDDTEKFYHVK